MIETTGYAPSPPDLQLIHAFIAAAWKEDIGDGDHTSLSTIPANAVNKAKLHIKDDGVLAGVELAALIFHQADPALRLNIFLHDGTCVKKGDVAFEVEGPARSILSAERLVLNCMQRMSGIATSTWELVGLIKDSGCSVIDTRKTTPGFRYFEKWAVRIGGGKNHRFGLYDMLLIKDNHVDYAGGVTAAIERAKKYLAEKKLSPGIEVEVRNFAELEEAMNAGGVQRIMLDNFSVRDLETAVKKIDHRFETEASGGINASTIRAYASTGVDFISCGAITHSARSLDMSLKAERK